MKHSPSGSIPNMFSLVKTISAPSFKNDIVVFSHLRWEFVTQRPQHIISRLALDRKVLFVE